MPKNTTKYVCNACGETSATWSGKCHFCNEWNTLEIVNDFTSATGSSHKKSTIEPIDISKAITKDNKRLKTSISDFDLVLGGGIVEGSVNLLAGHPGIGKSTLLLQVAASLSSVNKVLYVSGEESIHQVGLRSQRIKADKTKLQLAVSNSADEIAQVIYSKKYDLVIIDSVQTLAVEGINTSPGSVSQITNSTQMITTAAKASGVAVILVGHVTKEGHIAGPKILEHMVDVVLYLEGEKYGGFKILRANKNRFGSINETGIFEMTTTGMEVVANPSAALLEERQVSDGSVVLAIMEGTRPVLVEVQALVAQSNFGYPKRTASGFDLNRLNLLVAMLTKRTKLRLGDHDIFVNIVGGIKANEPAADLAVVMAIASAAKGMRLSKNAVVFGELGLSGEIRQVTFIESRVAEAKKLGFDTCIGPKTNKKLTNYIAVSNIKDSLNNLLDKN